MQKNHNSSTTDLTGDKNDGEKSYPAEDKLKDYPKREVNVFYLF
jgi:hypothetical protein